MAWVALGLASTWWSNMCALLQPPWKHECVIVTYVCLSYHSRPANIHRHVNHKTTISTQIWTGSRMVRQPITSKTRCQNAQSQVKCTVTSVIRTFISRVYCTWTLGVLLASTCRDPECSSCCWSISMFFPSGTHTSPCNIWRHSVSKF